MRRDELSGRISIDPERCFSKPCIRGHRIWVSLILDLLATGYSVEDVSEVYPQLSREDVLACVAYGAEMSRERFVNGAARAPGLRLKLEENPGNRYMELLRGAGHDIVTVSEQDLGGASDEELVEVCGAEGRVPVTLDLDFSNVLRFPPERYAGIVILRVPPPIELEAIHERAWTLPRRSEQAELSGKLWIGRWLFDEFLDEGEPLPQPSEPLVCGQG